MNIKFYLVLSFILLGRYASAQITLSHIYTGQYLYMGCFSTGEKYVVKSDSLSQLNNISVYNLDHSLFKSIHVPSQGAGSSWYLHYIADDLFDTDSTTIEYLLNVSTGSATTTLKVYRDDGTLLFQQDSVGSYTSAGGDVASPEYNYVVMQNDSGIFMQIPNNALNSIYLFKLPGKLHYCNSCCSNGMIFNSSSNENKNAPHLGNAIPNPSQSFTTIPYQLPDGYSQGYLVIYDLRGNELKRYLVGNAFHDLEISSRDFPSGTYLYSLQTADGKSDTKKMIVIK